jgi:hypothetical protein
MSEGLDVIRAREIAETRRGKIYLIALVAAIAIVIAAIWRAI